MIDGLLDGLCLHAPSCDNMYAANMVILIIVLTWTLDDKGYCVSTVHCHSEYGTYYSDSSIRTVNVTMSGFSVVLSSDNTFS